MSDIMFKKNKHMSMDERHEIQASLDHGMTFKAIAVRIGKDQTTVSKEVKKHITVNPGEAVNHMDVNGSSVAAPMTRIIINRQSSCFVFRKGLTTPQKPGLCEHRQWRAGD